MKKILVVLVLTFLAYGNVFAQQLPVLFKMRCMPGLKYTSTVQTNTTMEIDFTGDSAQLSQITARGTVLPVILQNKNIINYTLVTQDTDFQKNFPGLIKFTTAENKELLNGKQVSSDINPLTGLDLNAVFASDGKMQVDTGTTKNHADSLKILVAGVLNSTLSQVGFPDKPLKPDDTFSQDIPVTIPVTGNPVQLSVHIVYRLIAIQNKTALFDIVQSVTGKSGTTPQGNIQISGQGEGNLFYDVAHNFLKVYQTNLTVKYSMLMDKLVMTGTASMIANYQTAIVTNQ